MKGGWKKMIKKLSKNAQKMIRRQAREEWENQNREYLARLEEMEERVKKMERDVERLADGVL